MCELLAFPPLLLRRKMNGRLRGLRGVSVGQARPVGEAATHSMLRQPQWASERVCVVVSEGFGWALQRGISSRRRRNKSGDGRVPPREDGAERGVEREGGRALEMMTYNKPSSLN